MKKTLLHIIMYAAATTWALIGLFVILSVLHSTLAWPINIIMGLVFLAIGYFLYLKAKNSLALLYENKPLYTKQLKHFFTLETILFALALLLGLVLLSGTLSRVLGEQMAVFG